MNALFFAARRADLSILALCRRLLAPWGLTPARFDLLYTLKFTPRNQTEIARLLGVSRPVITRMVRSLMELGLVARFRTRRFFTVRLTKEGEARLRAVMSNVKKPLDRHVPEIFCGARDGRAKTLVKIEEILLRFQQACRKHTWILYLYNSESYD